MSLASVALVVGGVLCLVSCWYWSNRDCRCCCCWWDVVLLPWKRGCVAGHDAADFSCWQFLSLSQLTTCCYRKTRINKDWRKQNDNCAYTTEIMGSVPPASPQKPEVKGGALARRAGQAACSSWKIPEVEHAKPGTPTPKTTERKPS